MDENNHAPSAEEFVTVDFVCELFGLSRATVDLWLETGELAHYRLGPRTIRIARRDLDAFLAARHTGSTTSTPARPTAPPAPAPAEELDIRSRCSAPGEKIPSQEAAA